MRKRLPLLELFMRHVKLLEQCWLWTGPMRGKNRDRGFLGIEGKKSKQATHVAWWLTHRRWPQWPHEVICHTCDNPKCVRPSHLFTGRAVDNRRDAIAKGRQAGVGEEIVKQIRDMAAYGHKTQLEIARIFGVTQPSVSKIVNRRAYGDIS